MRATAYLLALPLVGMFGSGLDCGADRRAESPAPAEPTTEAARLDAQPCWFEAEPSDPTLHIECAVLRVPERWDATSGPELRLPVVIVRADAARRTRWATLVPGGGGPGASLGLESDVAAVTIGNHESIASGSGGDLVLVDQRGSGIAQPAFRCEEIEAATLRALALNLSVDEEAALWADTAARCRRRLLADGIALDAYDAIAVARDLEALRRALGYERWNLFGTSYAAEIALVYAREHPDSVRALVLDSPSIPGADLVSPAWFQHVVDELFARCAADVRCHRDFPALDAVLDRLLQRFAAKPLDLVVSHPTTLAPIPVLMTPIRLLDVLFTAMYDTELAHQIPLMLTAADRGSYDWLTKFVREYVWLALDPRFSQAMLDAVPCRETVPHADLARIEREAARYRWTRSFVGIERVTTAVCRAWDVPATAASPDPAVVFGGPALLLTGQLDPVIPLPDVERAAHGMPHSTLIEVPETGHATDATLWSCLDPLIGRFLADPDRALDGDRIEACRREGGRTEFQTLSPRESPLGPVRAASNLPNGPAAGR